jgi:hypothetical protein
MILLSFEWDGKTLKSLQVTSLKYEFQKLRFGAGEWKILRKEVGARRARISHKPHAFKNRKHGSPGPWALGKVVPPAERRIAR